MEDHALLCRAMVLEPGDDGEVDQLVRGEASVPTILQIVRRIVEPWLIARRVIEAGVRVVMPVGEELEHEERVGRATLSQIDLDGVVAPSVAVPHRHEVDAETAENALVP